MANDEDENTTVLREIAKEVEKLSLTKKRAILTGLRKADSTGNFKSIVNEDPDLHTVSLNVISATYPISTRTLFRYIELGKLKAVRFGRRFEVTLSELKRFLREEGAKLEE